MANGLYNASYEHDACGVGMVVNIHGNKSHELVDNALKVLENMRHRGAEGADNKTGDGAGIMLQIPHEFILLQGIPVPEKGKYGTGLVFLPKDESLQGQILSIMIEEIEREGLSLMHLRTVPTNPDCLGESALSTEPAIRQVFITGVTDDKVGVFERTLYIIRKKIEKRVAELAARHPEQPSINDFYICSLSSRSIVYKGMLSSLQLRLYFPDLTNSYFTSGLALVHSRFSTNTFPTWSLAQPFRLLCHNGEINTIRGNRGWMQARESVLSSDTLGDIRDISPIVQPGMSDSASLDNVFEFFVMSGLSLPHAMAVMVPESFNDKNPISEDLKAFYEYHSILMEPWDGPAALLFSDGRFAGGMLDRNGLRPARYTITKNDMMVVASEVGVMDFDPQDIAEKGRLQPGKILLIDTQEGKIYYDGEIKEQLATQHPYRQWLNTNRIQLEKIHSGRKVSNSVDNLLQKEMEFGFGEEDVDGTIVPMSVNGQEPTASMGNDTPLAVLSDKPQIFFNYFRQQFAQVTNPAIDSIRENLVMSLTEYIGRVGTGILNPDETNCKMVRLPHPILTNTQLDILCNIRYKGFNTIKLPMLFLRDKGEEGLREALDNLCHKAAQSVDDGYNYIILSDRDVDSHHVAIPSLLAVSAVHHYLISIGKRVQTALIVESGEIREVMHAALLLGYGASALCPYLTYAILDDLVKRGKIQENYATAEANYINAVKKGLFKIMAKMGISTIRSYRGAKIFESIGLSESLLRNYFGTEVSTVGGIGLETIAKDAIAFHDKAFSQQRQPDFLPNHGQFHYRKDGIRHAWNPETIATLQLATRTGNYNTYKKFAALVDDKEEPIFLRDFLDFRRNPIDIDKVEPVENIVRHFVTGAMSFGALSKEAHEAMALAMNKLGARSNTGEGGEDSERFHSEVDGISLSSKTKQVASGRFGVTTEYLVNAEEIQIKVAQGAKPGEGGQLPGFKVNDIIAKTRHSIPGISLISPPPHHDIYSIEDLAQLIFDLKNVNPKAAISVKLVAESGVGTIAAGVAKAKADLIVISGSEGGTGASPASSMRFAGISPEIGIAETQQTLVKNGLRGQVRLQVDGQLKSGRDIVLMALLGAEEFSFGTAALIVLGCVMMRKCSLNTCPMGVATQDPKLRAHFIGHYEYLVNYFTFLAQEVREYLAQMGYTRLEDIIGHTELIQTRESEIRKNPKYATLDFRRMLHKEGEQGLHHDKEQHHDLEDVLDQQMIKAARTVIDNGGDIDLDYSIRNTDRAVGTMLSGYIEQKQAKNVSVSVKFKGSAGQSFGAFLVKGVDFKLEGEANDYFAKGLSGGRVSILPPIRSNFAAEDNIIAGNTGLYGATSGELYINGKVGERFGVRNSGAIAVIEGAGDHCCEYMTGGRVVVLGETGRNFAAGMSGGVAYVWDKNHNFDYFCNMDMVEINLVEESSYRKELHELIRQHYLYTGSKLARTMLDDWNRYVEDFIQVVPIEYKRVLQEEQVKKLQQKIADMQRDY
ncbi:MAG: glutamate synthase large subunit [Prevotella sp.]|uniref:glutamate synthase large subunit n=1 Tax=Prevotella sp. P3-122 TaxID=2024223 RepID=UPI000B96C69F|nr:glutamate synthase large subunit [Prevotella sp. P3-122]MCI6181621.1 glutamate synthase large subunit [Prevotella sp.]MCI6501536.1 glutamate synthase large subunit [Prevotella sp.]MCI6554367.1 glutamate synthase large subunit [Prevotella sp.]MCI7359938.1 glutamate synthase large subunit [Prevotella sp.]MCI7686949.1 glutamate synthase large subunit [Prevotella sp.]